MHIKRVQRGATGRGVARVNIREVAIYFHRGEINTRGVDSTDVGKTVAAMHRVARGGDGQTDASRIGRRGQRGEINEPELLMRGVVSVDRAGVELEHRVGDGRVADVAENWLRKFYRHVVAVHVLKRDGRRADKCGGR